MPGKVFQGPKFKHKTPIKSLGKFFFEQTIKYGDNICQIEASTNKTETFNSIRKRTVRAALHLQKRGVSSEDIILFCTENTIDSIIPYIAATYLGAKVGSLDPNLSTRDTKHLLEIVAPKMIFVQEASLQLIEASRSSATQIVVFGKSQKYLTFAEFEAKLDTYAENRDIFAKTWARASAKTLAETSTDATRKASAGSLVETLTETSTEALGETSDEASQENAAETLEATFKPVDGISTDDTAVVFFSSGTTGLPKAICLSHSAVLYMGYGMVEFGFDTKALFHFTTLYWMSAVTMLITNFETGGYRVLANKFDAETIFRLIETYKVTNVFSAPTLTYLLTNFKDAEQYDTSTVDVWAMGGSTLSPNQLQRTRNLLKHTKVLLAYGMTEAGFVSMFDPRTDLEMMEKKMKSSGKILAECNVKIIDPDTNEALGPNQTGEIWVKTKALMSGYLNASSGEVFDSEGFLKTGDIGYVDEDGCLFAVDRIKEMFKYKAWHIVPSCLEAVILEHPRVKEAVVFGIPHEEDGDHPAAAVVLVDGVNSNEAAAEIVEFVNERVLDREKLRGGVVIVERLHKTPTGKLMRKKIRESVLESEQYLAKILV